MTQKIQIAPSLLAADLTRLGDEVIALEKAGTDVLHFDIMDGHFVPNLTFGLPVIERLRPLTKMPFDAHLMIESADRFLADFKNAGCDWLSVHIEACPHIHRTLNGIKQLGMRAGVAINPGTSLSALDSVLEDADYILVMSVNPGFGGQSFIPQTLDRLKALRNKLGPKGNIEIDGGVKLENFPKVVAAGANIIVMGTGLLGAKNYKTLVETLRDSLE